MSAYTKGRFYTPKSAPTVPAGEYEARLVAVRPFANTYGERVALHYSITDGPLAGVLVMQSAARSTSPRSKLGEVVAGLLGREAEDADMAVEALAQLDGLRCRIRVEAGANRSGKPFASVVSAVRAQ